MLKLEEGNLEAFFDAPFNAYNNHSLYVSPFKSDLVRFLDGGNPLFKHFGEFTFFTVSIDDKPVGRIVAHVHHASNKLYNTKRSYFGFFDCIDNPEAARILLDAAEQWGRQQSCDEIAGNFNLTAMQQMGVMTDGFDNPPYLDQLYSPPHIAALLKKSAYQPYFPVTTFEIPLTEDVPHRLNSDKAKSLARYAGLSFKTVTRRDFRKLMYDACEVLNKGFANNPMFVPLTIEEFWFQAKEMMWVMDPNISLVAYYDGKPAGVVVCIPDLNPLLKSVKSRFSLSLLWHYLRYRFNRKRAVIIYYSVVPEHHGKGLNSLMLQEITTRLIQRKYETLGVTWIADSNDASLRQMQKISGKPLHRLHLFRKSLIDE